MDFSQESLVSVVDNLYGGLCIVDSNKNVTLWNKAAERILGFSSKEMVGSSCSDNQLKEVDGNNPYLCGKKCPLSGLFIDGAAREAEVYLYNKNGHQIPVFLRTSARTDANGKISCCIEMYSDAINKGANLLRVHELEKQAMFDKLTQLANRYFIERELLIRFQEKKRINVSFGILFIDIDNLKMFNDTYGHSVGDDVLRHVSRILTKSTRAYDFFGRWGGDEIIGVIRNISEQNLGNMCKNLKMMVEQSSFLHTDIKLNATISIGATMMQQGDTIASLIKRADTQLYQSKKQGGNQFSIG
jgi:diguanylate cyclase (GGDEF)-like protein/PAS domain S-box-containing protein